MLLGRGRTYCHHQGLRTVKPKVPSSIALDDKHQKRYVNRVVQNCRSNIARKIAPYRKKGRGLIKES